jgi:tetratricopeptide (TPR) repeat protein
LASNTQIVANIHRSARPGKRIWIGILAAIALVTLPVLPLKFLGIPGPDLDWHSIESLFSKMAMPSHTPAPTMTEAASPVLSSDIKLMDVTVRSLLAQVSKNPSDPSLHNRVGLVYAELGEPHSAVTHFEESIKLSRQKIKSLTIASNQAMEKHDVEKASACTLEISALNVQLAAAHSSLARVYEQLGKSDRVMAQLGELSKDISLSKVIQPQSPKAMAVTAGSTTPSASSQLDAESAALLARADALRQAGRGLEAMQEYKRLSERVPNLALVHKEYGLTALAMRNMWLAQDELEKAVKLNGKDSTTHMALGTIQGQLGQNDKAISEFEKALAINPKEVNAAFNLGNIYGGAGQYDKAIGAFQKAVDGRPDFALAHNNLATMYSFTGDSASAAREFRQAIRLSPNMASAHYGLGIACLNEKNYNESARSFKKALMLNPDLIDAQSKLEIAQKRARGQLKFN